MESSAKRHKPNTPPAEESDLASAVTSAISAAHSFLLRHDHLLPPSQSLPLESLLSSAALSLRRLSLPLPLPPSPSPSWFLRLPPSSPLWSLSFRLSHPSFLRLLSLLPSDPSLLAAALLRLAHAAPYSSLSRRFSPSLPSPSLACRAFFSAVKSLSDHPHLFLPPSPSPSLGPTCRGFLSAARFGPAAISVQALISPDGSFLDISAGWPTTLKPDAILHQTRLYLSVEDSSDDANANADHPITHYVMGNSCFPLLPWLLTPYRSSKEGGELGPAQSLFNAKHRQAMRVARRAFGRLRRRWRILDREWKGESLEFLPFVFVACCLLHNFVEACGEGKDDYEDEDEEEEEDGFGVFEGEVSEEGERVRDAVAAHLSQACD